MSKAEQQPLAADGLHSAGDTTDGSANYAASATLQSIIDGKRGRIEGGALTKEALDSSRKVLTANRGQKNNLVGLQQWFSPPEAANLIAESFCEGYEYPRAVLDPTAGSGALLAPFASGKRFGIELDSDYTKTGFYTSITADAQKAVPMLRAAGVRFPAIAANPPFGLTWKDPAHATEGSPDREIGSTALTYLWALDLLEPTGQGAMICGRNRFYKEVLSLPEAEGVYAVVEVEGPLFDGVQLPTAIAFFVKPHQRRDRRYADAGDTSDLFERFSGYRADLEGLATEIRAARRRATGFLPSPEADTQALSDDMAAVAAEHVRREAKDAGKADDRHDIGLKSGKVSVGLRAYNKLRLAHAGRLREVQTLSGQHPAYFGQNKRAYRQLTELESQGFVSISGALRERAEAAVAQAEKQATPLFPLKEVMRLGWLTDLETIHCKKGEPEHGFVAGESYNLSTRSRMVHESEQRLVEDKHGDFELRQFQKERKILQVSIGSHSFDEGPENISFISEHFELPDPGCVASRYPDEVARNREVLTEIESEMHANYDAYLRATGQTDDPFYFKEFQLDHLSRLLTKGRGMLAHEQGLGKSAMQMAFTEAIPRLYPKAKNQALFVVPQDLIPQFQLECRKFFGRQMEEIRTPAQARDVARRVAAGEQNWWVSYFEALSIVQKVEEPLPEHPLDHKVSLARRLAEYKIAKRRGYDYRPAELEDLSDKYLSDKGFSENSYADETLKEVADEAEAAVGTSIYGPTTRVACPHCRLDTSRGWKGGRCPGCGYVHRSRYRKPAYSHLTTAFERGVLSIDEVSEIRGDDSLRSKAIRGISRGPHCIGSTGTPTSNFVTDAFWGLYVTLGGGSVAFPYGYDGKGRYERDFAVIENMMGREETEKEGQVVRRKVLPQISNVSQFWRLTQPGVSRCRKEQTGEEIVERVYHPIRTPMGVLQKAANDFWLDEDNFEAYFTDKFPEHELVEAGLVPKFAAALGQRWRLESAATLPAADTPSRDWQPAADELGELSNYTPANLKVLQLAKEHAEAGEKVLIGSDLIETGKWIAENLSAKGIRAEHITEQKSGGTATKSPRKRAGAVQKFVAGESQVLCAGVNALKLGHNLQCASTVILSGLPESWMMLDQFLARVHRLTSKRNVSVYVILPKGSLAEQKWAVLKDKGASSDLAWDGELQVQPEKPVDWQKVIKQMREQGIRASEEGEDLVDETDVEAAWQAEPGALPALAGSATIEQVSNAEDPLQPALPEARPVFSNAHRIEEPEKYTQPALF